MKIRLTTIFLLIFSSQLFSQSHHYVNPWPDEKLKDIEIMLKENDQALDIVKNDTGQFISLKTNELLNGNHEIDGTSYPFKNGLLHGKVFGATYRNGKLHGEIHQYSTNYDGSYSIPSAKLNFINIADPADKGEHGYPKLSPEHIITSNPDLIITTGENKERILKIKKRPGWKHINAIRNNMLLQIDPDIASRWGPRIINFASDIVNFVELD